MNFENSTHIIFVHKMDANIIDQTIGRAQRLGRQNRLNTEFISKLIKENVVLITGAGGSIGKNLAKKMLNF